MLLREAGGLMRVGIKRGHCKKNLMFLREDGGLTRGGIKRVHCKKF